MPCDEPPAAPTSRSRLLWVGVDAPDINPEIATHAAITGLKVDGVVAAAPRGQYQLAE